MALIAEAGLRRYFCEIAPRPDQALRQCDPPLQDVSVRRETELASERADELIAAQASLLRQLDQCHGCRRIRVDPLSRATDACGCALFPVEPLGRVSSEPRDQSQQRCLARHGLALARLMSKRSVEQLMQTAIREHRRDERERARPSLEHIGAQVRQHGRIEVEDAPRARAAADRAPVVDFAGIHADEVARRGFDLAAAAP